MGTWGPGVLSNDVARDVRHIWREALIDGHDDEAATAHVLEQLGDVFDDPDDGIVAWLALAAAQMQTGRLQPSVRDRALAIIDAGADVDRWHENASLARQRTKALESLAAKLRGPQPVPKTLTRPKPRPSPLDVGDVVHIRGKRGEALYVVVDLASASPPGSSEPVIAELLWGGGEIPDVETLKRLPLLHEVNPISFNHTTRPVQHLTIVGCPSRGKYALSRFGEVVAKGVLRPDAADHRRDQSRGFADGPSVSGGGWDVRAAFIGGPWHQRCVEVTRLLSES